MADAYAIALHPYESNTKPKRVKNPRARKIQKMNTHIYFWKPKMVQKKIKIARA